MYRSFSRDVTLFPVGHIGVPLINAHTTQNYNPSLVFDMDASECEQKSEKKPDLSSLPLSDYAKKLEPLVKQRYLEKISVIGIDPVLIEGKHFEADCLPPVESTDLLFFLVLETSFYTQQQFKAFRSLEAYNQMVSGFIASVQGHIIANKFVVLAKVRPCCGVCRKKKFVPVQAGLRACQ